MRGSVFKGEGAVSETGQVNFEAQGRACRGTRGESLLDALRRCGFEVPSLCHHPGVKPYGACRGGAEGPAPETGHLL